MGEASIIDHFILTLKVVMVFALPPLLVALILHDRRRRERIRQESIVRLVEKGLPVPPELAPPPPRRGSLRSGLVLVALGIALGTFFAQLGLPWSIGLIPGLTGVALLAARALSRRETTAPAGR